MNISPVLMPHSAWIGVHYSAKQRRLYVLPLPCLGVRVDLTGCWRHKYGAWVENLATDAPSDRYRLCERCSRVQFEGGE